VSGMDPLGLFLWVLRAEGLPIYAKAS